jgi:hypothetical protein
MSIINLSQSGPLTDVNVKMSFKTNKGTEGGMHGYGTRKKLSFNIGQYTTVFQAEVYNIKACTEEEEVSFSLKQYTTAFQAEAYSAESIKRLRK